MNNDPIQEIEKRMREIHDTAGEYTKPVFKRYPLTFAFLIVFSVAAILHGFEIFTDETQLFREHPALLMLIGIISLFFTGRLYKALDKMQ